MIILYSIHHSRDSIHTQNSSYKIWTDTQPLLTPSFFIHMAPVAMRLFIMCSSCRQLISTTSTGYSMYNSYSQYTATGENVSWLAHIHFMNTLVQACTMILSYAPMCTYARCKVLWVGNENWLRKSRCANIFHMEILSSNIGSCGGTTSHQLLPLLLLQMLVEHHPTHDGRLARAQVHLVHRYIHITNMQSQGTIWKTFPPYKKISSSPTLLNPTLCIHIKPIGTYLLIMCSALGNLILTSSTQYSIDNWYMQYINRDENSVPIDNWFSHIHITNTQVQACTMILSYAPMCNYTL
jgi:hypothetical protein